MTFNKIARELKCKSSNSVAILNQIFLNTVRNPVHAEKIWAFANRSEPGHIVAELCLYIVSNEFFLSKSSFEWTKTEYEVF